jgi:tRNA (mo5U34)-methyltransferase
VQTAQQRDFAEMLSRAKASSGADFEWYRYHSLTNLSHIAEFLTPEMQTLARVKGVLDVGCGDGDLSFYFESLGCRVTAVDHPAPNHNGMRGVRLMRRVLDSRIELREADLDAHFPPFERRFGMALMLGVLYHLKNPFYVLENLAKVTDYCILSTRIARNFPKIGRIPDGTACAYLLEPDELNQDNSNFWIFSDAALKLLARRSGWKIVAEKNMGDTVNSDAVSLDHDERKFVLLRSRFGLADIELGSGWHDAEPGGWRWTERVFSIKTSFGTSMTVELYVPPEMLARIGPISMAMSTERGKIPAAILEHSGPHTITRALPEGSGIVTFTLDKSLPPDAADGRERGLIIASVTLQ